MAKMIENIANAARDFLIEAMECGYDEAHGTCESPIEFALLHAVEVYERVARPYVRFYACDADTQLVNLHIDPRISFSTQKQIGDYRVDFCFSVTAYLDCTDFLKDMIPIPSDPAFLVVECDGHNFHERTPAQAERDRARDRDLTLQGFTVFRFTGREIYRDAWGCAEQIFEWANAKAVDLRREMRRQHGLGGL